MHRKSYWGFCCPTFRLTVGLDDFKGLFQPERFNKSIPVTHRYHVALGLNVSGPHSSAQDLFLMRFWVFIFSLNSQPSIWDAGVFFPLSIIHSRSGGSASSITFPLLRKNIPSPKAHKILFKLSLIKACNPWDPARLCGFPGGLLPQGSQINNTLNQFGLWRPTRNPNFLLGLRFSQLNLPLI